MIKQSFRKLGVLLSVFALISSAPSVQAISMPSWSSFNLSALKTPEAVSNALSKLSYAFSFLSPKTLASIVETQGKKFKENMDAYIKDPSLTKGGKAAANALAAAAASLALAGEIAAVAGTAYFIGKEVVPEKKRATKIPTIPFGDLLRKKRLLPIPVESD